jgi:hypothetical protein
MTTLAKIQYFCIMVERTTEFLLSVALLPGQLGSFPQFVFFEHAKLEFTAVLNANFGAYEILHQVTKFREYFGD